MNASCYFFCFDPVAWTSPGTVGYAAVVRSRLVVRTCAGVPRKVATAVLMQLDALPLKAAWQQVKNAHHSAFPQPDNRAALVRFERQKLRAAYDQKARQVAQQQQQAAAAAAAPEAAAQQAAHQAARQAAQQADKAAETDGGAAAPFRRARANSTGGSRAEQPPVDQASLAQAAAALPRLAAAAAQGSMGAEDFKAHGVDDAEQLSG